ncbi:MAG: hypothetical protein IPP01_02715 [Saprospiraceae bacterium]|nr:hypothetical protein [Saprospiraceae bacterium]
MMIPKKTFFSSQFPEANLASYYLPNLDSSINYYFKDQTGLFDLGNADPASTSKWNSKFRIYQYPIVLEKTTQIPLQLILMLIYLILN